MLASFPFLIRDMKASKRNCRNKETSQYNHSLSNIRTSLSFSIELTFSSTLRSQNTLVFDIKTKLCPRVQGSGCGTDFSTPKVTFVTFVLLVRG